VLMIFYLHNDFVDVIFDLHNDFVDANVMGFGLDRDTMLMIDFIY